MSHTTHARLSRRGGASRMVLIESSPDPMARLGAKVKPMPNGCWAFNGRLDIYGQFDEIGRAHV